MRGGCDRATAQALHAQGTVAGAAARSHWAAQEQGLITYRYVRGGLLCLPPKCRRDAIALKWVLDSSLFHDGFHFL